MQLLLLLNEHITEKKYKPLNLINFVFYASIVCRYATFILLYYLKNN